MLGAFLTERLSWRWVFYINLPVGLFSAALVGLYLRESGTRAEKAPLDYAGVLLLTGAVVSLLTLLLQAGTGRAWLSAPMLVLLFLTVTLTLAFVRQEARAADPMLPLSLFANPIILAATVGNILIGVMMYAVDSYMPLFMQAVRGGTAHSASLVLTPLVLFWSISAFAAGKALVRFGFRKVKFFGVSSILLAALSMACMSASTPTALIVATMAVLGSGLGPSSMSFLVSAQNAVSWQQRGVVTASSQFFRTISGTVGVGALGAILNGRLAGLHGVAGGPNGLLNAHARAQMPPEVLHAVREALAGGLHAIFLVLALLALGGFVTTVAIARRPESE